MNRQNIRRGFTLTELLVVIAIMGFLATLTALYFPRFQDREHVNRGADSLQMWLVMARQQARRDGLPTGLRFVFDTSGGPLNQGAPFCRQVVYIQQPEDVAVGKYVGSWDEKTGAGARNARAWFRLPVISQGPPKKETKFTDARFGGIKPGDYLELYGGGVVRRISKVSSATEDNYLELDPGTATLPGPTLKEPDAKALTDPLAPDYADEPVNYRIIRSPRNVPGEQELYLPENVGIDFNPDNTANPSKQAGKGPMSRELYVVGGNTGYRDILFAPSGGLIGASTRNAQVILWVRDLTRPNTGDLLTGHATLITVQPRTGFVAAHPAAKPPEDPYVFTKDAKSSGM